MTKRLRQTTMHLPLGCESWPQSNFVRYVQRIQGDISKSLVYRALRKTPKGKMGTIGRITVRRIRGPWCRDGLGILEATLVWEETE